MADLRVVDVVAPTVVMVMVMVTVFLDVWLFARSGGSEGRSSPVEGVVAASTRTSAHSKEDAITTGAARFRRVVIALEVQSSAKRYRSIGVERRRGRLTSPFSGMKILGKAKCSLPK